MRKLAAILTLGISSAFMQAGAQTLFTYGGTPVSKQEFLRVYQKNAINKKVDYSEPALREYLDLYALFKMKVKEADRMHLDTVPAIAAELDNYRHQLSKNYLTDKEVTNHLVTEAYDRMKTEVHVAHILISCSPSSAPADTLRAFQKIDSIYRAITKNKADFGKMAAQFSEDRGTKDNGGDIGYLTGLQTIYPFENAVYATPTGKISAPFRTQFGYHILKVLDKRPSRGQVHVAHILLATPKSKGEEGVATAKRRADSLVNELRHGASFDEIVVKFSDDKHTSGTGGVLDPFGAGQMVAPFDNAAFALKNPGDISDPVKTEYGYHIIRLLDRTPFQPFDSLKDNIRRRVDNDSRATLAHDQFLERIKKANGFKENREALAEIVSRVSAMPDTGANANILRASDFKDLQKPVFELGGNKYLQGDFLSFAENLTRGRLNGPKGPLMQDVYKLYVERTVNDYEEHQLADKNPDFKSLMDEYRNGIMIFDLMDRNVWTQASRDTVGLKAFYAGHRDKYQWEPGFTGTVYRFKDESSMKKGIALLAKSGIKEDEIIKALNTESSPDAVSAQRGHYEWSKFKDVPQSSIQKGKPSPAVKNNDGSYTVVKADDVYNSPTPKSLDEARGYAVAEYQDVLEKRWNAELRAKYPVKVDEPVFRSMVK